MCRSPEGKTWYFPSRNKKVEHVRYFEKRLVPIIVIKYISAKGQIKP